jgi:hypothetical protein
MKKLISGKVREVYDKISDIYAECLRKLVNA